MVRCNLVHKVIIKLYLSTAAATPTYLKLRANRTDATTSNIVGPTMSGVVASVCT